MTQGISGSGARRWSVRKHCRAGQVSDNSARWLTCLGGRGKADCGTQAERTWSRGPAGSVPRRSFGDFPIAGKVTRPAGRNLCSVLGMFRLRAGYFPEKESSQSSPGLRARTQGARLESGPNLFGAGMNLWPFRSPPATARVYQITRFLSFPRRASRMPCLSGFGCFAPRTK